MRLQCDIPAAERKLSRDAGARYAQEQGVLFEETSAKTGDNVDKIFLSLGTDSIAHVGVSLCG